MSLDAHRRAQTRCARCLPRVRATPQYPSGRPAAKAFATLDGTAVEEGPVESWPSRDELTKPSTTTSPTGGGPTTTSWSPPTPFYGMTKPTAFSSAGHLPGLYRFRTQCRVSELRFGAVGRLRQDRGSCLSFSCTWLW